MISLQNLAILWAFQGELVSALTRGGLMPPMYQSVLVPGARDRNEPYYEKRFHAQDSIGAVPPGELGRDYLIELGSIFEMLRDKEGRRINEVAWACRRVKKEGHQIYVYLIPHFPIYQGVAPGNPKFMVRLEEIHGETPNQEELEAKLQPGVLFFFLGYARRPGVVYELVSQKGATTVEIITGMGKKICLAQNRITSSILTGRTTTRWSPSRNTTFPSCQALALSRHPFTGPYWDRWWRSPSRRVVHLIWVDGNPWGGDDRRNLDVGCDLRDT